MDIQVKELSFAPAKVEINYKEMMSALEEKLKEYKSLIVTDETLSGAKAAQKELAGARTKIDSIRKEKKKQLEAPIKVFEEQCKDLISLIVEVEQPLKKAIAVYDDMKREEKRKMAISIIRDEIDKQNLNPKYAAKLTVLDKYTNLTVSKKDVMKDVEQRAFLLRAEQEAEEERFSVIEAVITSENERITNKLSMNDFRYAIESGAKTSQIITQIKEQAERIYKAENTQKKELEQKEETRQEETKEEPELQQQDTDMEPEETMYSAVYKIIGREKELLSVSSYLKSNHITYEVTEQTVL